MLDELRRRFESEVETLGISRVANALGVARGTVYNWIGNGNAPLDKLVALQNLGLDVVYVMTGQRGGVLPQVAMKPDEEALLDNYRNSSPEGKEAIKTTSAALAKSSGMKKKAG